MSLTIREQDNHGPLLQDAKTKEYEAEHDIADTAFWVNVDRSKRLEISKDIFAYLWITPKSAELYEEMAREVYPYSDISVSLRCRFYTEWMRKFTVNNAKPSIINIAAGFTMYPYLLSTKCRSLEIDYPKVVTYKEQKISEWLGQGKLPHRQVNYLGCDLETAAGMQMLKTGMGAWLEGLKGFVLMEGLTYYLSRETLDRLFEELSELLPIGSVLAFEHWPVDAEAYPVYVRFKQHLREKFGWQKQEFTLLADSYVRALPKFTLLEAADLPEVERRYADTRVMESRQNRLPHLFKVLQRVE